MHPIDDRTWPDKMKCDYCGEEHAKYGGQPSNKSWNEFMEWADEEWPYANVLHKFVYDRLLDYEKIGLLIEYLIQKDFSLIRISQFQDITLEWLEACVKVLTPKEDDEVEKLARKAFEIYTGGSPEYAFEQTPKRKDWIKIVEMIKGK